MFERFFAAHPQFQVAARPELSMVQSYEGRLPSEILEFWKAFGFGTFMNGYLKMVDPSLFQDFMRSSYNVFLEPATVFAATAFADLLIWEGDCVKQINYRTGSTKIHGDSIAAFFNLRLARWDIVELSMQAKQFRPAVERLGEPAFDECFAYVPALALGGSEKVENIQKVKLREHLSILSQIVGVIE
ncbi:MAG: DUF1851 domain-containing protein [Bacteroidetes bacterium]|nr:DUF1851 domain-containing protein [Bacteroidota bacterium]MBP6721110.1 DUF1851 domain-containing protein [Bacteroidia bacterium]MBP8073384.1 DUF1851 domain-containing protein [Bacteroidia bacterium]